MEELDDMGIEAFCLIASEFSKLESAEQKKQAKKLKKPRKR